MNTETQPEISPELEAKISKLLSPWHLVRDGISRLWADIPGEGFRLIDATTIDAARVMEVAR